MKNRARYTVENVLNNRFYQMPKFLFEGELKNISNDSRVLYSLLKDRHELSISNRWINESNEVYLIFTREKMADMLGCSQPTLRKALKELKKYKLIEEEKQGQGKPNLIFLTAVPIENTKTEKFFHSRMKDSFSLDRKNLSPNDTNNNNTDSSETIFLSLEEKEQKKDLDYRQEKEREIEELSPNKFNKLLKQSNYEQFEDKHAIEQSLRILYYSTKPLRINNMLIPPSQVREDLLRLDWKHIDFAIRDFNIQSEQQKIKYPIGYLSRCIYNAIFQGELKMKAELKYHCDI